MSLLFSYSKMLNAREDCVRRFGNVFSLPILIGSPLDMLSEYIPSDCGCILDFGAGPQRLKSFVDCRFPSLEYHSLDSDRTYNCDWASIAEIPDDMFFSLICADQVLEHIPFEDSLQIMATLSERLKPRGLFFATVPNTFHPNRFRGDVDHSTYVTYTDLYYLCSSVGLETLTIYRYSKRHPLGWFERFIARKIQDIYRMDWADSICIIARKPGNAA